jgi:hypothetical protein
MWMCEAMPEPTDPDGFAVRKEPAGRLRNEHVQIDANAVSHVVLMFQVLRKFRRL